MGPVTIWKAMRRGVLILAAAGRLCFAVRQCLVGAGIPPLYMSGGAVKDTRFHTRHGFQQLMNFKMHVGSSL
jgi:hypothetical protein